MYAPLSWVLKLEQIRVERMKKSSIDNLMSPNIGIIGNVPSWENHWNIERLN